MRAHTAHVPPHRRFTAVEESDGFTRCCCAPHHSFVLRFKPAAIGMPKHQLDGLPTLMAMEREGCTSKMCLGCCEITRCLLCPPRPQPPSPPAPCPLFLCHTYFLYALVFFFWVGGFLVFVFWF